MIQGWKTRLSDTLTLLGWLFDIPREREEGCLVCYTSLCCHVFLNAFFAPPAGRIATSPIPARTLIDISPVLLFTAEEYQHAKNTIVDHYSFVWNDAGRSLMALPLGLGGLRKHRNFR